MFLKKTRFAVLKQQNKTHFKKNFSALLFFCFYPVVPFINTDFI